MRIVDLSEEHEAEYFVCLEPWSEQMAEAGDRKERWYRRFKDQGLDVKLAIDDDGEVVGMIQVIPVELSHVRGRNLDFVLCTWVHGYDRGVGNRQGRGIGTALLEAAETASRARGRDGMAAWGLAVPIWMRASWYKHHGYRVVDRDGLAALVFKPFTDEALPPAWARGARVPEPEEGGPVRVTAFVNGWCPAGAITASRACRACAHFPADQVRFEEIDTSDPEAREAWGQVDALFIDGVEVRHGPEPSEEGLHRRIERAVRGPWWRRWIKAG